MKRSLPAVLFALLISLAPIPAFAELFVSINIAPPALPYYDQPRLPGDGYMWMPGYWDHDGRDYYWVPGTWVRPPRAHLLWTPGYWAWNDGFYVMRRGYWGPQIGYYGGVNYGHGYGGHGYEGGRWDGDRFQYNRAVNNVDVTNVHNTYNTTVINNTTINRVSYNGGNGGTTARPNDAERAVERQTRVEQTEEQSRHETTARSNPRLRESINHGRPPIAATPKAAEFDAPGVVEAKDKDDKGGKSRRRDAANHPDNEGNANAEVDAKGSTNAGNPRKPDAGSRSDTTRDTTARDSTNERAEPQAATPAKGNSKHDRNRRSSQDPRDGAVQPEMQQAHPRPHEQPEASNATPTAQGEVQLEPGQAQPVLTPEEEESKRHGRRPQG